MILAFFTLIGKNIVAIIGGLFMLGGVCMLLFGSDFWSSIGFIATGVGTASLAYVATAIVVGIDYVIAWIKAFAFDCE